MVYVLTSVPTLIYEGYSDEEKILISLKYVFLLIAVPYFLRLVSLACCLNSSDCNLSELAIEIFSLTSFLCDELREELKEQIVKIEKGIS